MTNMTRILISLPVLIALSACGQNGNVIGEDGVYNGELTLANPKLDDGSAYVTYTIDLEAGEELDLTMQSTEFDSYLHVLDENNDKIGEDDDSAGSSHANLVVIAPSAGTYTILANSFAADEYGEFVLAVRRSAPDGTGDLFTGVLDPVDGKSFDANSYPTHTIEAEAGERLDIRLSSGTFDAYLEVKDSEGNIVGEDDDSAGGTNAQLTLPIHSSDTYTLVVKSFGDGESGPYTLAVRRGSSAAMSGNERVEQFSGQLMDWNDRLEDGTPYALHVIEAQAGEKLEITMASHAFDSYLQLWDENEVVYAQDDDSGGGLNSMLTFLVPANGRYVVVANSVGADATGAYNVTVRRSTLDEEFADGDVEVLRGALTEEQELLADGTPASSHEIEAQAGERLNIAMMAGAFDAYLVVFDPDNTKLSEDDDSGGGTNAQLSLIAPTEGTYRIVANSYSEDATGPYTITVHRE